MLIVVVVGLGGGVCRRAQQLLLLLLYLALQNLLPIKNIEPQQMECVTQQHRLNLLVKGTGAGERGQHVYFEEPGLQVLVYQHVEAVHFEATVLVLAGAALGDDVGLDGHESLNTNILDPIINLGIIYSFSLKLFLEHLQTPLRLHLILQLLLLLLLSIQFVFQGLVGRDLACGCVRYLLHNSRGVCLIIFRVILRLLIHRIICQVHKSLFQAILIRCVWLRRQPHEALLENVRFERLEARDENVNSEVVLVAAEEVRF